MKTWAVITQKGGSGKTTIALHLAIAAEARGKKCTVIDLDPQKSAVKWSIIRQGRPPRVVASIAPELGRNLAEAERRRCALTIIDTSPRADRDSLEVSRLADLIVLPVQPSIMDMPAIEDTLSLLRSSGRMHKAAIVMNAVRPATSEARDAAPILEALGPLMPLQIGDRVDFRRALADGRGVTEFAPKGRAAEEIEALYLALAQICPI